MTSAKTTGDQPSVEVRIQEMYNRVGPTLVALLMNADNRWDVTAWLTGAESPTETQIERLDFALELFDLVAAANRTDENDGADMARVWFIGANTGISDTTPAEAIRAGAFDAVRTSATRAREDQWR